MAEWTAEEIEVATSLRAKGYTNAAIGQLLGKSRSSVQSWFARRDTPKFGGGCDRWTEEEEAELRRLLDAGMRVANIARKLDRTVRAVTGKKRRMHLAKSRSERAALEKLQAGDAGHVYLLHQYYARREQAVAA